MIRKILLLLAAACLLLGLAACEEGGAANGLNDGVRLAEIDENSQFEILENGEQQVVELLRGGVFFNTPEESAGGLEIRAGIMAVQVEGRAGWVQAGAEQDWQVFLLEGEAAVCLNLTNGRLLAAELGAGQQADISVDEMGEWRIEVLDFGRDLLPPLVQAELAQDEGLAALAEALPDSAPALAEPPEQWLAATLFEPVNPGLHLERSIVNMPGHNVEVYFEIPVFEDEGAAYAKINAFFSGLRDDFLNGGGRAVLENIWLMSQPEDMAGETYQNTHSASVTAWDDKYISVIIDYSWYMGGVMDYGLDAYVFDAQTGGQLRIDEVIEGGEAEIKDMIEAALIELEPGFAQEPPDIMGETSLERMRQHSLAEFDFYIENGQVQVFFDKYEIAAGAAGSFGVALPAPLK